MVVARKDVAVVENLIFMELSSLFSAFETGTMIMRMCCFLTRVSSLEGKGKSCVGLFFPATA